MRAPAMNTTRQKGWLRTKTEPNHVGPMCLQAIYMSYVYMNLFDATNTTPSLVLIALARFVICIPQWLMSDAAGMIARTIATTEGYPYD